MRLSHFTPRACAMAFAALASMGCAAMQGHSGTQVIKMTEGQTLGF